MIHQWECSCSCLNTFGQLGLPFPTCDFFPHSKDKVFCSNMGIQNCECRNVGIIWQMGMWQWTRRLKCTAISKNDCIEGSLNHPLQIIQTNETLHITGLVRRNIRVLTHHIYSHLTWLKLCDSTYCIALKGIAKKKKTTQDFNLWSSYQIVVSVLWSTCTSLHTLVFHLRMNQAAVKSFRFL